MIYIGLDPGLLSGAWGAIDHNGEFIGCGDIANNGERVHPRMLTIELQEVISKGQDGAMIVVEQVGAMPKQGLASTAKFMRATGTIEAVAMLLLYPVDFVTPQKWKKHAGLIGQEKRASLDMARKLWPSAPLKLVKHHGRADALLMARWLLAQEDGGDL